MRIKRDFKYLRQILKYFHLFHITIWLIPFGIYLFTRVRTVQAFVEYFMHAKLPVQYRRGGL